MEICDQKRLESLEEEKGRSPMGEKWMRDKRTSKDVCGEANFMQAWYQKNLQTLYQSTTCRQTHVTRTL